MSTTFSIPTWAYYGFLILFCSCAGPDLRSNGAKEVLKPDSTQNFSETEAKTSIQIQDRTIWQKPYQVIEMLGPLEDKVIADIGAGSGYFSFRFIYSAQKVIAVDIEKELIDMMNAEKEFYKPELKEKFEARLASPDNPRLARNEVDIVFLSNTYTYIQNRTSYLNKLIPCLKPGGRIVVVDFKKKITPFGPPMNQRLAQGDVETELLDAGFRIQVSDDTSLLYQYIIIAEAPFKG